MEMVEAVVVNLSTFKSVLGLGESRLLVILQLASLFRVGSSMTQSLI
jgi:hypothetical protein